MDHPLLIRRALTILTTVALAACGVSSNSSIDNNALAASPAPQPITGAKSLAGRVGSADRAIGGALVTLFVTTSGNGAPQVLAHTTTAVDGSFSAQFTCPASGADPQASLLYVTVAGGHTGASASDNAAIRLGALLGTCTQASATLTIDELTTLALLYSLNHFVSDGQIGGTTIGLQNALATAGLLVDPVSGMLATTLPPASSCTQSTPVKNCEALEKLTILAALVSACTSSSAANSDPCTALFTCGAPSALDTGSGACALPPGASPITDTWQAILSIARNPGLVAVAPLLRSVAGSSPVTPFNDWTLSLNFTGGGLSEPTGLALDAAGNVWIANYNNSVIEMSPTGSFLSPAQGFTGGGLEESFGIAIDATGHVWVCNEQSGSFNLGLGSVTELAADGSILSGPNGFTEGGINFPESLAIAADGRVWIGNFGDSSLTELAPDGSALSPATGFGGGGLNFPVMLSFDSMGNIWVANQGTDQISEFSSGGAPMSPNTGIRGAGLSVPQGIAIDQSDNVWVTNYFGESVSEFTAGGIPVSPPSGFSAAGINAPGAIAIDGAGRIWIANYDSSSLSELTGTEDAQPGSALSPATGFASTSLLQPFALAIDASGNVWVSNFGNNSITEFIGAAAPIATPLIGAPRPPT